MRHQVCFAIGAICFSLTQLCADRSFGQELNHVKTIKAHDRYVNSVAFSTDSKVLASGSTDMKVKLWNTESFSLIKAFLDPTSSVMSISFSPNGNRIAVCESRSSIKIIDISSSSVTSLDKHIYFGYGIAFSPDGELIAAGTKDHQVGIWSTSSGKLKRTLQGPKEEVSALQFSPNGLVLAVGSRSYGELVLIDVATGPAHIKPHSATGLR